MYSQQWVSASSTVGQARWTTVETQMNKAGWVRDALKRLFMSGDPPAWDVAACGARAGELPMPGPAMTLTPGYGLTRRSVSNDGVRVGDFLPQILAYHRRRNNSTLELSSVKQRVP